MKGSSEKSNGLGTKVFRVVKTLVKLSEMQGTGGKYFTRNEICGNDYPSPVTVNPKGGGDLQKKRGPRYRGSNKIE